MGRAPCCDKVGLKKGPWTPQEDEKLASHIRQHGHGSWRALPKKAGLLRCGKSCRLRWTNYLRPDIKRGELTPLEEQTIIQLHALLGNRWSAIAAHLPRRTDNEIKNHWNTHLKKRLVSMGLDPATHKPKTETFLSPVDSRLSESPSSSLGSSALAHMAQWESARLEAEARLAREAALRARGLWRVHASPQQPRPLTTNTDQLSPNQYLIDIIALKQQDLGQLILPSSTGGDGRTADSHKQRLEGRVSLTSADLVNSLHNWENSLQGQAGLAWPEAWRLSGGADGQQDSCSCGSAQEAMSHGSPTSTLCSFELRAATAKPERLSWSDMLQQAQSHAEKSGQSSSNDTVGSLPFDDADGIQASSDNNCADEDLSKSLLWSINNSDQSAHCQNAASRDKERGLGKPLGCLDQRTSPGHVSTVKSSSPFGRILATHEEELDHYWDNLLAYSPRQIGEEPNESLV